MKYYIISGEVSGDLHGAFLIKELKKKDPNAEFRVWGGDNMIAEGIEPVKHIKNLAFMGFVEVLANLKTILGNIKFCKQDILSWNPDCVIFIDYPGFNLRIAKFCHKKGLKTFYYISPQVWAWKKGRIKTMKKVLTKLFVILPFEKEFYKKHNMKVDYVGSPLLDEISDYKQNESKEEFLKQYNLGQKPIVAILPGSRTQEIKAMLPIQMSLVEKYPEFDFVLAGVSTHSKEFYKNLMNGNNINIAFNQTYPLLNVAHSAVVCSGTATLETALFNVPEVVCYKANWISYVIGRYLVDVKYISLVNLILDKLIVLELIQSDFNENDLEKEFKKITFDENYRTQMQLRYSQLRTMLGDSGASANTAKRILELLEKK